MARGQIGVSSALLGPFVSPEDHRDVAITEFGSASELAMFRGALDELPTGIAIIDRELRFRYVNVALAAMNGLPVDDHIGRTVADVVPGIGEEPIARMAAVLDGGLPVLEHRVTGTTIARPLGGVWRETYRPLRDAGGAIEALLATVEDVTEATERAAALDQERADAAVLAALSRDVLDEPDEGTLASIVLQVATKSLRAQAGAVYLAGSSSARLDLVATEGLDAMSIESIASVPTEAETTISQTVRTWDVRLISGDETGDLPPGDPARVLGRGGGGTIIVPLRSSGGAIGAFAVTVRDRPIDGTLVARVRTFANVAAASLGRARAARRGHLARTLLEAVIAQMPLGIAVTDAAGGLIVSNPALEAIWRGSRRPLSIDEHVQWSAFHPDGRPYDVHERPVARSLEAGEIVLDEELAIERFDGTRGAVSVSSAPVRDADGTLLGAAAIVTDITERREREAAREAFLDVLAHELRTPLTTMLGAARLLARPSLGPDLRDELTASIADEAERMTGVVENLLVVSRIERGIEIHAGEPILAQRIVTRVVAAERTAWPAVSFDVQIAKDLAPARGDDHALEQVLRNLLSNAAKYGGGRVAVRVTPSDGGIRIEVADDGPGIDASELAHVFELYYRSAATAGIAPGAGVGLFVVRHLVAAMGGEVWAEAADPGTRFVVRLRSYEQP